MAKKSNCPNCGEEIDLEGKEEGEVLNCPSCQTKLVIEKDDTGYFLSEAPEVEEDWGQ